MALNGKPKEYMHVHYPAISNRFVCALYRIMFFLQIKMQADLPVGENFQDHPMCIVEYKVERPLSVSMDNAYYKTPASKDYQQYMFFIDGMDCALLFCTHVYVIICMQTLFHKGMHIPGIDK